MLPAWCSAYIGLPFAHRGRGPDAYDCWGLVRVVLAERFGLDVPGYMDMTPASADDLRSMAQAIRAGAEDWACLSRRAALRDPLPPVQPRPGDVALMRRGIWPCHVGIVVAPGWMLHALEHVGSTADRLDGPEAAKIVAFYRHRDLT